MAEMHTVLQPGKRRVAREVALEVRRFVAERYPDLRHGLAVASDDAPWARYGREFVSFEEAGMGGEMSGWGRGWEVGVRKALDELQAGISGSM